MHRIKQWVDEARNQKHTKFDDLDRIVRRLLAKYSKMFPKYRCTRSGSKTVHHFNVSGVNPISLEKEHGNREFVPRLYKTFALDSLEALIAYVDAASQVNESTKSVEEE